MSLFLGFRYEITITHLKKFGPAEIFLTTNTWKLLMPKSSGLQSAFVNTPPTHTHILPVHPDPRIDAIADAWKQSLKSQAFIFDRKTKARVDFH